MEEEIPPGSRIGEVAAVDADEGDNAVIEYAVVDGNDDRLFAIERGPANEGIITLAKRLDRWVRRPRLTSQFGTDRSSLYKHWLIANKTGRE